MSSESSEEPKLIIDEDWKTQVQREKEELKQAEVYGEASGAATEGEATQESPENLPPPPPASLEFLVTTLATQAMAALGQIPGDEGKPLPVNLEYARHFIDLIGVLEEKTKGNLRDDESSMLQDTLHQMRMVFVAISQQVKK